VGVKAPWARPGARVAGGVTLEARIVAGERSDGMLCAEDELGLSTDHSGLLLLPADAPAGLPLEELIGEETVFDLEITWNRPDCLSIIGMAREIAALTRGAIRWPETNLRTGGTPVGDTTRVRVEDPLGCPRYTVRALTGVRVGPAPFAMRRRLSLCGVRAINNVVDVTNYVQLECGQPLHAFDTARLTGGEVVVRRARTGERIRMLDGFERTLPPETLVIADTAKALAVAGVMGGEDSGIVATTTAVLIESALFRPADIHGATLALGVTSESSHRFERGVDAGRVDWAGQRAAALMMECAGATVCPGVLDVGAPPGAERRIA
jgi:phenylalanyl-tRNA synthetase beta chain